MNNVNTVQCWRPRPNERFMSACDVQSICWCCLQQLYHQKVSSWRQSDVFVLVPTWCSTATTQTSSKRRLINVCWEWLKCVFECVGPLCVCLYLCGFSAENNLTQCCFPRNLHILNSVFNMYLLIIEPIIFSNFLS